MCCHDGITVFGDGVTDGGGGGDPDSGGEGRS